MLKVETRVRVFCSLCQWETSLPPYQPPPLKCPACGDLSAPYSWIKGDDGREIL